MKNRRNIILQILVILIIILVILILISLLKRKNNIENYENLDDYISAMISKNFEEAQEGKQNSLKTKLKIKKIFNIEDNKDNNLNTISISDEDFCRSLLSNFIDYCLYYPEKAYELLNKDYREARFKNLEGFKEYREDASELLQRAYLSKYGVEKHDDYTEYVLIDQFENYYTFTCYGGYNYEIILDNYTLPTQNYLQGYANGTARQRVNSNVRKFIEMINSKDYANAYEKLADSFKQNKFEDKESFKKYIKENLYEYNDVEFVDYTTQGNLYIYEIKITDKLAPAYPEKNMQIIMQLGEGLDFKISFNIK